ncbi:MAG TPA: glutathione S-transferase family protein [Acetobacteraceae bacterium]|nr:glutathione S-transferase family protein [Acetobacteraceae bacterium]
MTRILWGRSTSSNVMKVIWLLEELKLPYERRDVGGPFGKTDTPEYRAMNPTGLVPTLQEDDFTLWESNAILRYICTAHAGNTPWFPWDAKARGSIDRWMDAQQTVMNRPQGVIFLGLVRTPPEKRDQAAIKAAIGEAARAYGYIGAELARHPFICGDAPTLADICWGVHVHRWFTMEFDRPEVPNLRAWYDRLLSRPVYREHIARPLV